MSALIKKIICSVFFCFVYYSTSFANIKVGAVFFEPPFVYSLKQGFNIDLTNAICKGINEQCDFVAMNFNELFTALDAGTIDVVVGMYIDDIRRENYIFSIPYMLSNGLFVTLKSSKINTVEQLNGDNIGIVKEEPNGGIFYHYLIAQQFKVTRFDDMEDAITALTSNKVDAAFLHKSTAGYWITNGNGMFQIVGKPLRLGDGIAFMALPANAALIQRINQQLLVMENSGDYLNLYKTYFSE